MKVFSEADYISGNWVERISPVELSNDKKWLLLKECLAHYTGGNTPELREFEFIKHTDPPTINGDGDPEWYNCICSKPILHGCFILHKPTGMKFKIGRTCFANLYGKSETENFFKPKCINCDREKVNNKRTNYGKEGFCSKKCLNIYNKKRICSGCGERFWRLKLTHLLCRKCFLNSFFHEMNIE